MLRGNSLSHLLLQTWWDYKKQVWLSQRKISARNVHQLRISTQRLEARLTLANSLQPIRHFENIVSSIKKVRKNFGPLRDIQVETAALKNLIDRKLGFKKSKKLILFFAKKKMKAKKKAYFCLKEISFKQEQLWVDKLIKKIQKIEKEKSKKQIQSQLKYKIKFLASKFNKMRIKVDSKCFKEIHRLRILVKKLRYQIEFLNLLTDSSEFDLENLKTIQSVAGKIQNNRILLGTLDQFLKKNKYADNSKVIKIQKCILSNQEKLIKKASLIVKVN